MAANYGFDWGTTTASTTYTATNTTTGYAAYGFGTYKMPKYTIDGETGHLKGRWCGRTLKERMENIVKGQDIPTSVRNKREEMALRREVCKMLNKHKSILDTTEDIQVT